MTHSVGVSLRTPGWAPRRLVLSTHFVWLRARVRPSVMHVGGYTMGKSRAGEQCAPTQNQLLVSAWVGVE